MPENTPAISVIIPAYNQANYVSEAIQSVLGQTCPNFELIVVDDGSTDKTPEILEQIKDPRMRVVRQSNAGLSAARNTGLRESSAPLVTFLDSDDYFLPDKLEILSSFLDDHSDIGLVAGRVKYIDSGGNTILEPVLATTKLKLPELLFGNPISVSSILLRRKWLDRVGVFDERLRACEDWDLWLRLLAVGCHMAWVEQPVVTYRIHPGQMTRESDRMRKAILSMLDKFFGQPELPENIKALKNGAYAAGFVHAAAFAYLSGEFDSGQRDLAEAIHRNPTLKDNHYRQLVDMLVGWASDPRSADEVGFLQRVISHLPPGEPGLKGQLYRALADIHMSRLFSGSRESRRVHRWEILKAIRYKPDWLFNRGVLRMLVDAWLTLG